MKKFFNKLIFYISIIVFNNNLKCCNDKLNCNENGIDMIENITNDCLRINDGVTNMREAVNFFRLAGQYSNAAQDHTQATINLQKRAEELLSQRSAMKAEIESIANARATLAAKKEKAAELLQKLIS